MTDKKTLPMNLPDGALAFQKAISDKLTPDVWGVILEAQITKAKEGDRGAAKFLLEYAGGVAQMRGATFVQENHHHEHFHGDEGPRLTKPEAKTPRTIADLDREREAHARLKSNEVNGTTAMRLARGG